MAFVSELLVGMVIGACVGLVVMCVLTVASDREVGE